MHIQPLRGVCIDEFLYTMPGPAKRKLQVVYSHSEDRELSHGKKRKAGSLLSDAIIARDSTVVIGRHAVSVKKLLREITSRVTNHYQKSHTVTEVHPRKESGALNSGHRINYGVPGNRGLRAPERHLDTRSTLSRKTSKSIMSKSGGVLGVRARRISAAYRQCRLVTGFGDLGQTPEATASPDTGSESQTHADSRGSLATLRNYLHSAWDDIELARQTGEHCAAGSPRLRSKSFTYGVLADGTASYLRHAPKAPGQSILVNGRETQKLVNEVAARDMTPNRVGTRTEVTQARGVCKANSAGPVECSGEAGGKDDRQTLGPPTKRVTWQDIESVKLPTPNEQAQSETDSGSEDAVSGASTMPVRYRNKSPQREQKQKAETPSHEVPEKPEKHSSPIKAVFSFKNFTLRRRGSKKSGTCGNLPQEKERPSSASVVRSRSFTSPSTSGKMRGSSGHGQRDDSILEYRKARDYYPQCSGKRMGVLPAPRVHPPPRTESDIPPPLPERTYLKLRELQKAAQQQQQQKDDMDRSEPSSRGRSVSFSVGKKNTYYQDHTATVSRCERCQCVAAELRDTRAADNQDYSTNAQLGIPPMGIPYKQDMDAVSGSSGYGSLASATDSCSVGTLESDYAQIPFYTNGSDPAPPLPSRTGVSSGSSKAKSATDYYSTSGTLISATARGNTSFQENSTGAPGPCVQTSPGGVQLVKVLRLDGVLKNKWVSGLAVTRKGEYVVVDLKEAYLLDENGNLKRAIGSKGSTRLREPLDVTVMCNGNLVFSDHLEQDVKIFNCRGQFLRRVKDPSLTNIAGVATNDRREVIIAGTDKHWVSVHSEDDEMLYTIPPSSGAKSPFDHPYSVAVNPLTGDILVGDDNKQLVTALSPESGRVLWRFCPTGDNRHFFPSSLCVDNCGYVFVADLYNEKVYMLDSAGKYLKTILDRRTGLRGGPGAIAADGRGNLLVADEEKSVKIFCYRDDSGFIVNRRSSVCPDAT